MRGLPVSKRVPRTEAEAILGDRFVKDALALSPADRSARVVELSLTLEKAIERAGFTKFNPQDQAEFKAATAAGPSLVTEVLKTAIADGKTDLAAVLATALGDVTDANALAATGRPHRACRCALPSGPAAAIRGGEGDCEAGAEGGFSRIRPSRCDAGRGSCRGRSEGVPS